MRTHDATEQAYKKGYEDGQEDARSLRPCLADDKPATFHRWVDESGLLCCTTLALVEYPDGSVGMVKPELIQFLGRKED